MRIFTFFKVIFPHRGAVDCCSRLLFSICRMAGNSKFVLRWEIDNATAVHAAGKAESNVFNEGGFEWNIKMDLEVDAKFTIRCGLDQRQHWKCEGNANLHILMIDGSFVHRGCENFLFDDDNAIWCPQLNFGWQALTATSFCANDKFTMEFHINATNSERGKTVVPCIFTAPNSKSNVILKIGGEKLHVSKEYLAVHSPVFDALFFGDFTENGKEEVELKDIVYEEFLDLLNVVYLQTAGITDRTVPHILKLADRFQMKHVLGLVHNHLRQSKGFDTVQKLIMADQYRLDDLMDRCVNSLTSIDEWADKMKSYPEVTISDNMKIAIYDRLMKLKLQ